MKLTFVGAAHEVTGSCHFLQVAGKNILVDCGMEQGPDLYENPGLPISATDVDYVFLTHAYIVSYFLTKAYKMESPDKRLCFSSRREQIQPPSDMSTHFQGMLLIKLL